jgi:hypothetical protein
MPQVNIHCMGNYLRSWFFEILDFWGPDARRAFIEPRCSFFQARRALLLDQRHAFVRRITLLPNGQRTLIRRVALFPMGNTWVPNG